MPKIFHQGTLGCNVYGVIKDGEFSGSPCVLQHESIEIDGQVFERSEFQEQHGDIEMMDMSKGDSPSPASKPPPHAPETARNIAIKAKQAKQRKFEDWSDEYKERKKKRIEEYDKKFGLIVPTVRDSVVGQGLDTDHFAFHKAYAMMGHSPNIDYDDWRASAMQGRGQGWRPRDRLMFDKD